MSYVGGYLGGLFRDVACYPSETQRPILVRHPISSDAGEHESRGLKKTHAEGLWDLSVPSDQMKF